MNKVSLLFRVLIFTGLFMILFIEMAIANNVPYSKWRALALLQVSMWLGIITTSFICRVERIIRGENKNE